VFDFVPGGLLHRLTFKSSIKATAVIAVWQSGVTLEYKFGDKEVHVLMELVDTSLYLSIITELHFPVQLYADFLKSLKGLLDEEFSGLNWKVEASCPCSTCVALDYQLRFYVSVDILQRLWDKRELVICHNSLEKKDSPKFAPELFLGNVLPTQQNDPSTERSVTATAMASSLYASLSKGNFLGDAEFNCREDGTWEIREKRQEQRIAVAAAHVLPKQQQHPSTERNVNRPSELDMILIKVSRLEPILLRLEDRVLRNSRVTEEMNANLSTLTGTVDDVKSVVQSTETKVDGIALTVNEIKDTVLPGMMLALLAQRYDERPTLFVLVPKKKTSWEKLNIFEDYCELQFLCEHHTVAHVVKDTKGLVLRLQKEKVQKALNELRPYFEILDPLLGMILLTAGAVPWAAEAAAVVSKILEFIRGQVKDAGQQAKIPVTDLREKTHAKLDGPALRALDALLEGQSAPEEAWTYLERRVYTPVNRVHWLCLNHRREEDSSGKLYADPGSYKGQLLKVQSTPGPSSTPSTGPFSAGLSSAPSTGPPTAGLSSAPSTSPHVPSTSSSGTSTSGAHQKKGHGMVHKVNKELKKAAEALGRGLRNLFEVD